MKTTSPGRPKAEKKPRATNRHFYLPKDIDRYRATKLQVAIRQLDNLLATDPAKFNAKAYSELLSEFAKLAERMQKNDKQRMAAKRFAASTADMGAESPFGVGAGVPAENPFTR